MIEPAENSSPPAAARRGVSTGALARSALLALLATLLLVLVGCGSSEPEQSPQATDDGSGIEYVALGDSYTAGPYLRPQTSRYVPGACGQSEVNYPQLVADQLKPASFTDRSCASASIAHFYTPQKLPDGEENPAQGTDIGEQTKLVTMSIGGNDFSLTELLSTCLNEAGPQNPCDPQALARASADEFERSVRKFRKAFPQALKDIRERAPETLVVVVGYPQILPDRAVRSCVASTSIDAPGMVFIDRQVRRLNNILESATRRAGQHYVDTYGPSKGHNVCSDEETRWIEPVATSSDAQPFHPNELGQQKFAELVLAAVEAARRG